MKIALAAAELKDRDLAYNIRQIERFMKEARANGAELVCFGETFLQGFNCFVWNYEQDRRLAISVDSEIFQYLCRQTAQIGIDLLFGFVEEAENALYSSCALVADGRLVQLYRRISKGWKEYTRTDAHYREGTDVLPFYYRGRRCLIGLCGDLWDVPQRFCCRQELLFWPVYVSFAPADWESHFREEYARQAARFGGKVLLCNSFVQADAHGGAAVFAEGRVLAQLPMGQEGILYVDDV